MPNPRHPLLPPRMLVEYDLQKKEAAYRKILVIAEDNKSIRPKTLEEL